MTKYANSIGVKVPELLLPNAGVDMTKWAVVACDQYTSQPDYWNETEAIVGDAPSTLRIMLPELYLDKPDEAERIVSINSHMKQYVENGVLEKHSDRTSLVMRGTIEFPTVEMMELFVEGLEERGFSRVGFLDTKNFSKVDVYTIEQNRVVFLWRDIVGSDQGTNIPNN